ncbi:hypothetical protein DW909_08425 [Bifidobacterium bifidum]|uniref:hypothetical protein n=1 Tax=Bifidobacterium bifidum TaxID=1681 RepID=UPI000E4FB784|nr:hypothetical protein [Bifidobacterium bifidum]RHA93695.1 hypothetical protein DW909_08425 [Bifidobacterium bifidum]
MNTIHFEHPSDWLANISGNASMNKIAETTGLPYSTINRRFQTKDIPADEIIVIARGYGLNPAEALVQCGKLTVEEFSGVNVRNALRVAPIRDIAAEIIRRNADGIDKPDVNDPNLLNDVAGTTETPRPR